MMDFEDGRRVRKKYDAQQAYLKARGYCAYQERSQQEVRDKLYSWGVSPSDLEEILVKLIDENFLNEARFALAYAGGKFRIKQWGKVKIKQGLKAKAVSEYCIKKALASIDAADYRATLNKILRDKGKDFTRIDSQKAKYKIAQYAIGRGFESNLVWEVLNDLMK